MHACVQVLGMCLAGCEECVSAYTHAITLACEHMHTHTCAGLKEEALAMATDSDYRFELGVALGKLDECYNIVLENESDAKWKQLGDLVLSAGNFTLATECLTRANDHSALLLLYSCQGNRAGMESLAKEASAAGRTNIAFVCNFLLGRTAECLDLLVVVVLEYVHSCPIGG